MKNIFIKMKNHLLITTIVFDLILVLIGVINYFVFNIMFRQWFYYFIFLANIILIIIGIIQIIKNKGKTIKME